MKRQIFTFAIITIITINIGLSLSLPLPVNFEIASSKTLSLLNPQILRILSLTALVIAFYIFAEKSSKKLFFFITVPWFIYIYEFRIFETIILIVSSIFYQTKKYNLILLMLILLLTTTELQYNHSLKTFLNNYSLSQITLKVNEKQRHIPEKLIRKISYNKLTYATDETISHFVSFFDFEQWASPKDSYELLKLSGLLPKNNPLIFFSWQIPIILLGLIKYRPNNKLLLLGIYGSAMYFIFEKRNLADTSFLILPLATSIYYNGVKNIESKFPLVVSFILLPLSLLSVTNYLVAYHKFPQKFLSTDLIYYQKIGTWLRSNNDDNSQIIISQRFGPTDIFIPYYFQGNNLIYKSFYITEEYNQGGLYIGLSGEFVGKGKNSDNKMSPNGIKLIDKLTGDDEVVFEHGKDLWIGIQE